MADIVAIAGIAASVAVLILIVLLFWCIEDLISSIINWICVLICCGLCYLGDKARGKKNKQAQNEDYEDDDEDEPQQKGQVYYIKDPEGIQAGPYQHNIGSHSSFPQHPPHQNYYPPPYFHQQRCPPPQTFSNTKVHHSTYNYEAEYVPNRFNSRPFGPPQQSYHSPQ